jgi:hydroxyacylglutathione hydrolase
MSLIFKTIQTNGIAQLSYLIGDNDTGTAAVIDPRSDVDHYLELARKHGLSITHIFETHIHADFMSGARELSAKTNAKIYLSTEGDAQYGFEHESLNDGQTFTFGNLHLEAKHTPGHTPEHISFIATEINGQKSTLPWGVFSGDSLFVNSTGRPDLLGDEQSQELAEALFHTLNDFYAELPDGVIIYPGHGHGSPCGASIGDRVTSTIGFEKKFNPFMQFQDIEKFKEFTINGAPPEPTYYRPMKKTNSQKRPVLESLPPTQGLPPSAFKEMLTSNEAVLIDTRSMLAFGGGHIDGAINIGASPELSIWSGWLLDPSKPLLLVLEKDSDLENVQKLLLRTGFTKFAGYLSGGLKAWIKAGYEISSVAQISVHELHEQKSNYEIIDVRSPEEWKKGRIPLAKHFFLPELQDKLSKLKATAQIAVYCASGYRASIATSILKKNGFTNISNVPGSWSAWKNANYPIEKDEV